MFSKVVIVSGLLSIALGATLPQQEVPILSESSEVNPDGSFQWQYQSGDGTQQQHTGQLKQIGHDAGEVMQGVVSWTDPQGGKHELRYVADENGYQPQSADLPVAPEIPAAILRSLDWIAAHPIQPQTSIRRF